MRSHSRRAALRLGGLAGATLVAGCLGDSTEYGESWEDVTRIRLEADVNSWTGVSPAPIEGANNPALRLIYGRRYELECENVDGNPHRFTIVNHEGQRIEESEEVATAGETVTLEFDAVFGITEYVCPHYDVTMRGNIEIFSP